MRIVCSKCGTPFESVLIDQRAAFNEIVTKSTNHVRFRHKETFEALAVAIQKCSMTLAQFLHFDECVVIPENEEWILEQIAEGQDMLLSAMGYDEPDDDDDDEDEPIIAAEPEVMEVVQDATEKTNE